MTTDAHNPLDFQGQAEAEDARQKAKESEDAQVSTDYEWLMQDERGRRIVWEMLSNARVFQPSYVPGGDSLLMAFNEGNRNQGLRMQALILQHCPALFMVMLDESNQKGTN